MAILQRISPVRRSYNQLVADETMEDYALRFTASSARRFSARRVGNTAFGATSFMALEAIGGAITLQYGTVNAVAAILAVGILIALTAAPIAYAAAKAGVDIDLLTRAAGFGYIGSTITSLIYASFTFIFFAIEASILTNMLSLTCGLPLWLGYIICAVSIIPLVTNGITFISRFQAWTQPFWIVLNFLPMILVLAHPGMLHDWGQFHGSFGGKSGFSLLPFGLCTSVIASLIAQVGEQVDYLRFLKPPVAGERLRWWAAMLLTGPGWIVPGMIKMLAGSMLAVLAVGAGLGTLAAAHPPEMYVLAYGLVLPHGPALLAAALLIVVSQTKINVTNAYAGSIAWSNFFSRLTHRHPGRVVWLIFNVVIGLLLMELGIYSSIQRILAFYSVLACAWVGSICADLVLVKGLRLGPPEIEFKRAHLYDINPVGIGSMGLAVLAGSLATARFLGPLAHAFAPLLALLTAFIMVPIIAGVTGGRVYLARKPRRHWQGRSSLACSVCGNAFEPQDVAYCPAYAAPICSLCCTLDARCHDACKPHARYTVQLNTAVQKLLPKSFARYASPIVLRFLGVFGTLVLTVGLILAVVYWQASGQSVVQASFLAATLWRVFICLLLVAGIFSWLQVLARESSNAAEEESRRQTRLLQQEINAHRRTDRQLARAREVAEAANHAKTRFVVGISHELRTPLNAVLGYAQLLELDPAIPPARRDSIRVIRRSGEHMHGLIEGLMDISKIEAGRIEIERREVRLPEFLSQITGMFRLQAAAKGVAFIEEFPPDLPALVTADEIRLRQILINLLSNALKFTAQGQIRFSIRIPGEVMEFRVTDTGSGIAAQDLGRIFEPFERVMSPAEQPVQGIGLGLTLTKLLVEILGGRITVTSELGQGSSFLVQLRLPVTLAPPVAFKPQAAIIGYEGPRRRILAAEDNAMHRALLEDILIPLGFTLVTAPDGPSCLRLAADAADNVDLFLLDLSMPQMEVPELDGLNVARQLRSGPHAATPIVILSAHAPELTRKYGVVSPYDAVLAKPVNIDQLLATIGRLLKITWQNQVIAPPPDPLAVDLDAVANWRETLQPHISQLRYLAQIGFISGLRESLVRLEAGYPEASHLYAPLQEMVENLRLPEFLKKLDEIDADGE
jgi:signal transduction histidine kinase/purine-cytosine permease-like protein/DNA-binding response OmpR family regulator